MKLDKLKDLSALIYGNRRILIVSMLVTISVLIVDASFLRILDLTSRTSPNYGWRLFLFVSITLFFVVAQYFTLEFINRSERKQVIRTASDLLDYVRRIAVFQHYILAAILVTLIVMMILYSYYSVNLLTASTSISYGLATGMMSLLAYRFLLWFKFNRNYVVLFYAVSACLLAINSAFTMAFVDAILLEKPPITSPRVTTIVPIFQQGSIMDYLYSGYLLSLVAAFISMWLSTAWLLKGHSKRLGKSKYWIIVSIPLVYFLSQFLAPLVNAIGPLFASYPLLFTLIFVLSKPAGGILFGAAFWSAARSMPPSSAVRNYLIISSYGVILFFVSGQISLISVPYPPFGILTISAAGTASYLMFLGLYSAAISLAQDQELRRSIRRLALSESKFLDTIGFAHLEHELQIKVAKIVEDQSERMTKETGVEPSLSDTDIKQYLEQVLVEIKGNRQ
jgi:hypothetical protein